MAGGGARGGAKGAAGVKVVGRRPFPLDRQWPWLLPLLVGVAWVLAVAIGDGRPWLNGGGWVLVGRFVGAARSPELSPEFLAVVGAATLKTLAFAVCGTVASLGLGTVGGLLGSRLLWRAVWPGVAAGAGGPWLAIRAAIAVPRAIHEAIWGLFFVSLFGLDPLVAIAAIALPFGAAVAKVFSEILDETPPEPFQALLAAGASPLGAFCYGLLPGAFLNLLAYGFYRFECALRSAAVLGIIGAGGLGYEILLSLRSLRYGQLWTLLAALAVLTGLTDWWSGAVRSRLGTPTRLDLTHGPKPNPSPGQSPVRGDGAGRSRFLWGSAIAALILTFVSFSTLGADYQKLWAPQTWERLQRMGDRLWPLPWEQFLDLWEPCRDTLAMATLAIAVAGAGGTIFAFLAARNLTLTRSAFGGDHRDQSWQQSWGGRILWGSARLLLLIARAIPEPIWALLCLFVLFPGILPGGIALGLHNLGILGRLMAETVENLDERPLHAIAAGGASDLQVFSYGILPRVWPRFLAYILYRWEVCIRATTVVGLVGAGGLGRLLAEQTSSFDYGAVAVTLLAFGAVTILADWLGTAVRSASRA